MSPLCEKKHQKATRSRVTVAWLTIVLWALTPTRSIAQWTDAVDLVGRSPGYYHVFAHWDADGDEDLILAEFHPDSWNYYGSLGWYERIQEPPYYVLHSQQVPLPGRPVAIAARDLNDDGRDEVVVAINFPGAAAGSLWLFLAGPDAMDRMVGHRIAGGFHIGEASYLDMQSGSDASPPSILLFNTASGRLASWSVEDSFRGSWIETPSVIEGISGQLLLRADLNMDGYQDFIFRHEVMFGMQEGYEGQPFTNWLGEAAVLADPDADGDLDILTYVVDTFSSDTMSMWWLEQTENGYIEHEPLIVAYDWMQKALTPLVVNFGGDDRLDLAFSNYELIRTSGKGFEAADYDFRYQGGQQPLAYVDVNGDGKQDWLSRYRPTGNLDGKASTSGLLWMERQDGENEIHIINLPFEGGHHFQDVDGDGVDDLVGDHVWIRFDAATGTFSDPQVLSLFDRRTAVWKTSQSGSVSELFAFEVAGIPTAETRLWHITPHPDKSASKKLLWSTPALTWSYGATAPFGLLAVTDVTGDSLDDVVMVGQTGEKHDQLLIKPGKGTGFDELTTLEIPVHMRRPGLADLNGDGRLDVYGFATSPIGLSQLEVWFDHATLNGTSSSVHVLAEHFQPAWYGTPSIRITDVNRDMKPDLMFMGQEGRWIYLNGDDGPAGPAVPTPFEVWRWKTIDLDLDGYVELYIDEGGSLVQWYVDEAGMWSSRSLELDESDVGRVMDARSAGDFNGDGLADLIEPDETGLGSMISFGLPSVVDVEAPHEKVSGLSSAWPNPARTHVNVSLGACLPGDRVQLRVVDMLGRSVASMSLDDATGDVVRIYTDTWVPGTYLIRTDGRAGCSSVVKVVKLP